MVAFSREQIELKEINKAEEVTGKLEFNDVDEKLMHSVLENDKNTIEEGKIIENALNRGISSFNPDLMMQQFVKDYKTADEIYGKKLISLLSGYDEAYVKRNIKIPEFQKVLKEKLGENIKKLKQKDLLDDNNTITNKGIELASLIMYSEELDNIIPKGIHGEKIHKKHFIYGSKEGTKDFRKGDRYKDIEMKKSVKTAIRRGHKNLEIKDLKVYERQSKGRCHIVYAIDASGSMRGKKIEAGKKAGIALAYKAIREKDRVGLIVFGEDVKEIVEPTDDFTRILKKIAVIRAARRTNIAKTIKKAISLFPSENITKHLLLLTDALPTAGKEPEKETLEGVSIARNNGLTVSLIGIKLDKKGEGLGKKIVDIGQGKFYKARNLEEIDKIVLEDYYSVY